MTTLICTYCSARKRSDEALLPAILRYQSERIADAAGRAERAGCRLAILSGRYGLIAADHPIACYDHLLAEDEIPQMIEQVSATLVEWEVRHVLWLTVAPAKDPHVERYRRVMDGAALAAGARLEVEQVSGDD